MLQNEWISAVSSFFPSSLHAYHILKRNLQPTVYRNWPGNLCCFLEDSCLNFETAGCTLGCADPSCLQLAQASCCPGTSGTTHVPQMCTFCRSLPKGHLKRSSLQCLEQRKSAAYICPIPWVRWRGQGCLLGEGDDYWCSSLMLGLKCKKPLEIFQTQTLCPNQCTRF